MLARTTRFLVETQQALEHKNKELKEAQRDIFDSIKFAGLIQTSLMPDVSLLKVYFMDAAYTVKQQIDIGGDTVHIVNTQRGVMFGLSDSTGHGIPAAMLNISTTLMLNEIVASMGSESPATLHRLLNYRLLNAFRSLNYSIAHMEGSLFHYNEEKKCITYSLAKGKALLLKASGEITELRANKQAVGEHKDCSYENSVLEYEYGDKLILHSDGLTDQFGGPNGKKYSKARLQQFLLDNRSRCAGELNQLLSENHREWKGAQPQTDDTSFLILDL